MESLKRGAVGSGTGLHDGAPKVDFEVPEARRIQRRGMVRAAGGRVQRA